MLMTQHCLIPQDAAYDVEPAASRRTVHSLILSAVCVGGLWGKQISQGCLLLVLHGPSRQRSCDLAVFGLVNNPRQARFNGPESDEATMRLTKIKAVRCGRRHAAES